MEVLHFNNETFKKEVLESDVPVLVDFWATWCGPCRAFAPTLDKLAAASNGEFKVGKVDVDENEDLAAEYGIQSIPTVIVFKGGEPAFRHTGALTLQDLLDKVK
ncbi:MAG: thioredoxin [Lachnospiraceae bacterium]|nr:thioredoxin [Lachnospiraceae bacterium]